MEYLTIKREGKLERLDVTGVFIFVGFLPNTQLFCGHVNHDEHGYIITNDRMETSVEGLFAAGDIRAQLTRQITTAVGDGTTAAIAAQHHIEAMKDAEGEDFTAAPTARPGGD